MKLGSSLGAAFVGSLIWEASTSSSFTFLESHLCLSITFLLVTVSCLLYAAGLPNLLRRYFSRYLLIAWTCWLLVAPNRWQNSGLSGLFALQFFPSLDWICKNARKHESSILILKYPGQLFLDLWFSHQFVYCFWFVWTFYCRVQLTELNSFQGAYPVYISKFFIFFWNLS